MRGVWVDTKLFIILRLSDTYFLVHNSANRHVFERLLLSYLRKPYCNDGFVNDQLIHLVALRVPRCTQL